MTEELVVEVTIDPSERLASDNNLAQHDHQIGATLELEHFEDLIMWLGQDEGYQMSRVH